MSQSESHQNLDPTTVASFGDEWAHFDQTALSPQEHEALFDNYFHIFPWDALAEDAQGFDMGCGSGRWARLVAPRVGQLSCIDPSAAALAVTKRALSDQANAQFIEAGVDSAPLAAQSQDFGYSLGVLHHIPDTAAALKSCTALLKPGAPFLVYLYYRFDNKPAWYRRLWQLSEGPRWIVSRMPDRFKTWATTPLAALVYYPLARAALIGEKCGLKTRNWPLYGYRDSSFYSMRTDARDRFGTPLEQRFTKVEIEQMMQDAGLTNIVFSDRIPYWTALGWKAAETP